MKCKISCPECGKLCGMETLNIHYMTTHKGFYPFKCSYCEEGFQNKKRLKTHITKKHEGIYFHYRAVKENGLECGKIIISEEGIIDHIKKQYFHGNKSLCTQCDLLVFPCLLSEHLEDSSLTCPVENCREIGQTVEVLQTHVDTEHCKLEIEWYNYCGEFFIDLEDHHKLRHRPGVRESKDFQSLYGILLGKRCQCDGCGFIV